MGETQDLQHAKYLLRNRHITGEGITMETRELIADRLDAQEARIAELEAERDPLGVRASELERATKRIAELEGRLAHLRDNRNDLVDRVAELAKENVQLKADIADLERNE